ncbi:MAG: hypothetical protein A2X61_02405 [Ignavibacteria bacterium GWB2_35_12]|nr:MAG: hypothetical protein A2X63_03585 [Ignavibacteria bacterium GWA2_35_8]OGU42433.1 MAG: hypothetical protein A2X61_02405 [Ignavibacteria bacterium GWB2_35_12]OGU96602.1 MAG: hypothetical protein A2220_11990 [Ignavibacteria bacterium RIFOXYA2_FULL_35_10]OGV24213.1 MAG: hypothetical protein A2475_08335 [Ignavibacteria bacterium RIFOXYC2_FULL_35_21]
MKKLFLFLLFNICLLLNPLPSKAFVDFGSSLEYDYFNKQNQLIASFFITDGFIYSGLFRNSEYNSELNVSIGLRNYQDKIPDFIYRLSIFNLNELIPITEKDTSRALRPGYQERSFWNYLFGLTIINYDKTQIENQLMQWAQFRAGYGFSTYKLNLKNKFNYEGFLTTKLGLTSIDLGEYNFEDINYDKNHFFRLETGLNFLLDMSYKRNISIKTELDYTLLIAEIMIHKINIGLVCVGNYFIPNKRCENCYNDYLKFSFGVNYNNYFVGYTINEYIKYEFVINYFYYYGNYWY